MLECGFISIKKMASGGGKSAAFTLLIINACLYFVVAAFSGWAVNHAIEVSHQEASALSYEVRLFPIYFPIGNMATGFLIIFSLIAGVVGFITSVSGILNVVQWNLPNLHSAAYSSLISWLLTLLAMGLACKEIHLGWTESNLRTLEVILIILGGTQLFVTGAIHSGIEDLVRSGRIIRGNY